MSKTFIGVDISTEGTRAILVDENARQLGRATTKLSPVIRGDDNSQTQDPNSWIEAVKRVLSEVISKSGATPSAMAITATSGTFLLANTDGNPIAPAAMYNDGRANSPIERARIIRQSIAGAPDQLLFAHTPEFVIAALTGQPLKEIATDWSHGLKTGANHQSLTWESQIEGIAMPKIVAPGAHLGKISKAIAQELSIPEMDIYAGMTDGCTGQISAGGTNIGSAVTTLGTTMVIKIVANKEITGPGFYSHLLPTNTWLAGGASNLGGISYKKFGGLLESFNERGKKPATYATYPLIGVGERFPIANKELVHLQSGEPQGQLDEYRAILEGIAFAERLSYEILEKAGAPINGEIYTVGGGSKSTLLSSIRATVLNRQIALLSDSGSDIGAAMIAIGASAGGDLATQISKIEIPIGKTQSPDESQRDQLEARYQEFLALIHSYLP
jgi:sugar (pentulose or hexulose) kinase